MQWSGFMLVSCLSVSACTATGPGYESEQGEISSVSGDAARIVFYRTPESVIYSARKARISIDGEKTGAVSMGGFIYRDVAPGQYSLTADMWDAPGGCSLLVTAEAGSLYYFQVDPRKESLWSFAGPAGASDLLGQSVAVSVAAGVGSMAAESYGRDCGGAFRLYPVAADTAQVRIADLRLSE
jgi:hypothetical protein